MVSGFFSAAEAQKEYVFLLDYCVKCCILLRVEIKFQGVVFL